MEIISFSDKSIRLQALLTEINKEQIICIGVARGVPIRGLVNVLITHTFTKCGWHSSGQHSCFVGPGVGSVSKSQLS